ncbi:hypothetical protein [Bosea sp. LjRoot237]|uniref:hypothetical protein n=1 Tax=Bosea sp. LjRoot237 TaxID=3342292 RepID=UPI003ECCAFF5
MKTTVRLAVKAWTCSKIAALSAAGTPAAGSSSTSTRGRAAMAIANLLFSGTIGRYPKLCLIFSHAGRVGLNGRHSAPSLDDLHVWP